MKILLPYLKTFSSDSIHNIDNLSGGREYFCKLLYRHIENVVPVEFEESDLKNGRVTRMIIDSANQYGVDVIINNYNERETTVDVWSEIDIPIMWVNHVLFDISQKRYLLKLLNDFTRRQKNLVYVSEYQYNNLNKFFNQNLKRNIISPVFSTLKSSESLDEIQDDIITISRIDEFKHPFQLPLVYGEHSVSIFSNPNTVQQEYFDEYSQFHHLVKWTDSHDEILENITRFKVSMMTCPYESWGISAFESLERGVPVIAVAEKNSHASLEISRPEYVELVDHVKLTTEDIHQCISRLSKLDRRKISQDTINKHTKQRWLDKIQKSLEDTIKSFS